MIEEDFLTAHILETTLPVHQQQPWIAYSIISRWYHQWLTAGWRRAGLWRFYGMMP